MKKPRKTREAKARIVHPHGWIWELLECDPTFVLGSMFGAKIAYLDGLLMLCFAARDEVWRGVLVCTERGQHASLMRDFPPLKPHAILGKWLYLPESADTFEKVAVRLVKAVLARDPRIGIIPGKRKKERP